jgi:hypothetical protein
VGKDLIPVKYVGRHGAVEFDPDGFGEITVVHGQVINVPEKEAQSLLLQEANWRYAGSSASSDKEDPKADDKEDSKVDDKKVTS